MCVGQLDTMQAHSLARAHAVSLPGSTQGASRLQLSSATTAAACRQRAWQQQQQQQQQRCRAAAAAAEQQQAEVPRLDTALDDELSKRPLELDASGYFIIKVDRDARELVADFYTNVINEQGLACDPVTGEVISCKAGAVRLPARSWRGRTAKELGVEIVEKDHGFRPVTHLEHALYLGRELQRAEFALVTGQEYVQD